MELFLVLIQGQQLGKHLFRTCYGLFCSSPNVVFDHATPCQNLFLLIPCILKIFGPLDLISQVTAWPLVKGNHKQSGKFSP